MVYVVCEAVVMLVALLRAKLLQKLFDLSFDNFPYRPCQVIGAYAIPIPNPKSQITVSHLYLGAVCSCICCRLHSTAGSGSSTVNSSNRPFDSVGTSAASLLSNSISAATAAMASPPSTRRAAWARCRDC